MELARESGLNVYGKFLSCGERYGKWENLDSDVVLGPGSQILFVRFFFQKLFVAKKQSQLLVWLSWAPRLIMDELANIENALGSLFQHQITFQFDNLSLVLRQLVRDVSTLKSKVSSVDVSVQQAKSEKRESEWVRLLFTITLIKKYSKLSSTQRSLVRCLFTLSYSFVQNHTG